MTERPLRQVTSGQVASGAPWRTARSASGQVHYPGSYWSATTGGHVIYESRLELACLLLADFDPDVTAIAAQPLLLRAQTGERVGGLLDRLERSWPRPEAKVAVLRLLWQRSLSTDLSRPLDVGSILEVTR